MKIEKKLFISTDLKEESKKITSNSGIHLVPREILKEILKVVLPEKQPGKYHFTICLVCKLWHQVARTVLVESINKNHISLAPTLGFKTLTSALNFAQHHADTLEVLHLEDFKMSEKQIRIPLETRKNLQSIKLKNFKEIDEDNNEKTISEKKDVKSGVSTIAIQLPPDLKKLQLFSIHFFSELPDLPKNLTKLVLFNVNITKIPVIPPNLQSLKVSFVKGLIEIPGLPVSLKRLTVTDCQNIKTIENFPTDLLELNLHRCPALQKLPKKIPDGISELNLNVCKSLTELPELSKKLQKLFLAECKSLKELPELPESLRELDLGPCKTLFNLPTKLPPHLKFLKMNVCNNPNEIIGDHTVVAEKLSKLLLPGKLETLWICNFGSNHRESYSFKVIKFLSEKHARIKVNFSQL